MSTQPDETQLLRTALQETKSRLEEAEGLLKNVMDHPSSDWPLQLIQDYGKKHSLWDVGTKDSEMKSAAT